jgi:ABC-type sugar transport system ATPase subunit
LAALIATNVSRRYGVHHALADTTLRFEAGTVTAIVGGNGAGKSTLLNLLGGVRSPTTGTLRLDEHEITTVRSAMLLGISFSHQEVSLIPDWTVADHFAFAGRSSGEEPWRHLAPDVEGTRRIHSLSPHEQQCLEVSRALASGHKAILLDEPTALLGVEEKGYTLRAMVQAAASGRTVVWVTHDLPGALEFAHRIVVLRDGKVVRDVPADSVTVADLLEAMSSVARPPSSPVAEARPARTRAEKKIEIHLGAAKTIVAHGGEIVGIVGSARSRAPEVLRAAVSLTPWPGLSVRVDGAALHGGPQAALRNGIGYMSRERSTEWLFDRQSVAFNIAAGSFNEVGESFALTDRRLQGFAQRWTERFDVKVPSLQMDVDGLSGGNRQKTVLARLAAMRPAIMFLDEPFSGVDRPTRTRLFHLLRDMASDGVAILIYSQECEDLIACTDRVCAITPTSVDTFQSHETDAAQVERAVLAEQGRVA